MEHVTFPDAKVFLITLHLFPVTRWHRSLRGQSVSRNKVLSLSITPVLRAFRTSPPLFSPLSFSPSGSSHLYLPVYPLNPSPPSLRRPPSHLLSEHHFSNGLLEGARLHLLSLFFHLHPSPPSISAGPLTLSPLPPPVWVPYPPCTPLRFITAYLPNLSPIRLSSPQPSI